jgi:uncharacterized protein
MEPGPRLNYHRRGEQKFFEPAGIRCLAGLAEAEQYVRGSGERSEGVDHVVIGAAYLFIQLPEVHSLKEKRQSIRSIIKRVQSRFNVAVAEVDNLDVWQSAGIGLVCVSNSNRHADEMLQNVIRFVEEQLVAGYVAEVETELLCF